VAIFSRVIFWSVLFFPILGSHGCSSGEKSDSPQSIRQPEPGENAKILEQSANRSSKLEKEINKHLVVSKRNEVNEVFRIGKVTFDKSNQATLSIEGSGPAAEELKKAWQEIVKFEELTWKQSRTEEVDGKRITRIVGERAKPGEANYIYAVMNTLERKYGFAVDINN
jgi:hypothetical protein